MAERTYEQLIAAARARFTPPKPDLPEDLSFTWVDTSLHYLGRISETTNEGMARAEELLRSQLNATQRVAYDRFRCFEVKGSEGGTYVFDMRGVSGPLYITDAEYHYCIYPDRYNGMQAYYYPADNALSCKLAAECSERKFRTTAVKTQLRHLYTHTLNMGNFYIPR